MSKYKLFTALILAAILCCSALAAVNPKDYIVAYESDGEAVSAMLAEIQKKNPFIADNLDMWTQWGHICFDIHRGLYESANTKIVQLKSQYSDKHDLPKALYWLGNTYWATEQYQEAVKMYQQVIDTYPDCDDAIHAAKNKTIVYIRQKDFTNSQIALQQLLNNYENNSDKPGAVQFMGNAYWKIGQIDKAFDIYQHVINTWPQSDAALHSQKNIVLMNIKQGKIADANQAYMQLIIGHAGNIDLERALIRIGNEYYRNAFYGFAQEVFEDLLLNWPDSYWAIFAERSLIAIELINGNYETADNKIEDYIQKYTDHEKYTQNLFWLIEEYSKYGKEDISKSFPQIHELMRKHRPIFPD